MTYDGAPMQNVCDNTRFMWYTILVKCGIFAFREIRQQNKTYFDFEINFKITYNPSAFYSPVGENCDILKPALSHELLQNSCH